MAAVRAGPPALLVSLALLVGSGSARAADELTPEQRSEMDALRAELGAQIQLQAYDLIDQLVYDWGERPVFASDTPVVLADVGVPVGFGSGLGALLENHLAELLIKNPRGHLILAHCPRCVQLVVHSTAKGTVISRGVDQPEVLTNAGQLSNSHYALFLDFEVEGSALVLRARITSLEPSLPIVQARTLSTSTATPALLRSGDRLKSAAEAHQEYVDALAGRGLFLVPVRVAVRSYAGGSNSSVSAPPFVWLMAGMEVAMTQARAWTGSASAGFTWAPDLYTGFTAQGRIARLLTGNAVSLSHPDLYGFVGGGAIIIQGKSAAAFQDQVPDINQLLAAAAGQDPIAIFGTYQLGLELRVKNRISASVFLEAAPALDSSTTIGSYLDVGIKFHTLGAEVSFCF